MDLHQYLDAVKKYWWAILIPAFLAGLLGVSGAMRTETSYRSSVTFFVATRGDATVAAQVQGDQFATRRVNSYVALLTTDRLAQRVVDATGVDLTAGQVRSMISASGDLDTVLLTATVTSRSKALALELADGIATEFVDLVSDIENGDAESGSVTLEVVSGPTVRPVPARPMLGIVVRVGAGMLLGLGLAVLLHLRDHTVRSQDDLRSLGLDPILGSIPLDRRERSTPLYVEDRMQPVTAEAFRHLRTSLQFIDVDRAANVLVVSSSVPGEGKSFVSRNLALTIAAANVRVLLIEADLRRPTVSEDFGVVRVPGISDVLAGRSDLEAALRPWRDSTLTILPSGYLPPNPSELLGSEAARHLISELRERFDVVVIDTPPLLPVTDGAVLAAHADGVILVVREGRTTRHQLGVSAQRLSLVGARYLGAVMNMVADGPAGSYATYEREGGAWEDTQSIDVDEYIARPTRPVPPRAAPEVEPEPIAEDLDEAPAAGDEAVEEETAAPDDVPDEPEGTDPDSESDRSGRVTVDSSPRGEGAVAAPARPQASSSNGARPGQGGARSPLVHGEDRAAARERAEAERPKLPRRRPVAHATGLQDEPDADD